MTVVVKGLTKTTSQIVGGNTVIYLLSQIYNVAGQINGKTVYGVNHIGTNTPWADHFVVNFKDL
jgi:hypothetical protein